MTVGSGCLSGAGVGGYMSVLRPWQAGRTARLPRARSGDMHRPWWQRWGEGSAGYFALSPRWGGGR